MSGPTYDGGVGLPVNDLGHVQIGIFNNGVPAGGTTCFNFIAPGISAVIDPVTGCADVSVSAAPPCEGLFRVALSGAAFTSIQAAIDAAAAAGGGVVKICPGVYAETLTAHQGVNVQAEDYSPTAPGASEISVFVAPPTGVPLTVDLDAAQGGGADLSENATRWSGISFRASDGPAVLFEGAKAQLAVFENCQALGGTDPGNAALEVTNTGVDGVGDHSLCQIQQTALIAQAAAAAPAVSMSAGQLASAGPYEIVAGAAPPASGVSILATGGQLALNDIGQIVGVVDLDGFTGPSGSHVLANCGIQSTGLCIDIAAGVVCGAVNLRTESRGAPGSPAIGGDVGGVLAWSEVSHFGTASGFASSLFTLKLENSGPDLLLIAPADGALAARGQELVQVDASDGTGGATTVTLPPMTAMRAGGRVLIKEVSVGVTPGRSLEHPVTIVPTGGDTIDGELSYSLVTHGDAVEFTASPGDPSIWRVTGQVDRDAGVITRTITFLPGIIPTALPADPFPLPLSLREIWTAGVVTQGSEDHALAPRRIEVRRVSAAVRPSGGWTGPATFSLTCHVAASASPSTPGFPGDDVEAVVDAAFPSSGGGKAFDFSPAPIAEGDNWGVALEGFDALGPLDPGERIDVDVVIELFDEGP